MTKTIQLTQGQVAIVCDCHAHLVERHKWCAELNRGKFYAGREASVLEKLAGERLHIAMHSVINRTPKGFHTDHIDGDPLNNQCSNLRTATKSENQRNRGKQKNNTSGYKGVTWHKHSKTWDAKIVINNKTVHLGSFHTPEEAARAYDTAALDIHGEFAYTNF